MKTIYRRWAAMFALSSGALFASSCDSVTGAVLDTIGLAFGIADIWV